MYVKTFTYGKIPVEPWEFPLLIFGLLLVYLICAYIKKKMLPTHPEYRYFLWGLLAKIFGGAMFVAIYIFYYQGGDTTSYYECSLAYCNMFTTNFSDFLTVYLGGGTHEIKSIFTNETGSPMMYMFGDDKTRMVIKILVPFMLLGFKSYFVTTLLISVFTYGGLWRLYMAFCRYFPQFKFHLAVGILFMPSVLFWGSGILKDSFTLAATCYFIVATNAIITKVKGKHLNWFLLFLSGFIILSIKPYILIILLPGTLVWYFYSKIRRIENKYFRVIIVPFVYVFIIGGSFLVLTSMSDKLGKFAPSKALKTAAVIQQDLKQDYYGGNSFDIGEFDPTISGLSMKFFPAVAAGLFRPFIWEARNPVMIISGIENLLILFLTIAVIVSIRRKVLFKFIAQNPIVLYSFLFSILFAFMIGVTTSNFGAMVRFKIPLIPLYMASVLILFGHLRGFKLKRSNKKYGLLK